MQRPAVSYTKVSVHCVYTPTLHCSCAENARTVYNANDDDERRTTTTATTATTTTTTTAANDDDDNDE